MMDIAIYVEGGGDTAQQKAELRNGFDALLHPQKQAARAKCLRWKLVPSGGRDQAFENFRRALDYATDSTLVILLVDSEEAVVEETGNEALDSRERVRHLSQRDGWNLANVNPTQVHLMVQSMEAWIVSDAEALAKYYGNAFRANQLPVRANLEEEPKASICSKLQQATCNTSKGEYAKIKHASKLLALIVPEKVGTRCKRFKSFTDWLTKQIEAA